MVLDIYFKAEQDKHIRRRCTFRIIPAHRALLKSWTEFCPLHFDPVASTNNSSRNTHLTSLVLTSYVHLQAVTDVRSLTILTSVPGTGLPAISTVQRSPTTTGICPATTLLRSQASKICPPCLSLTTLKLECSLTSSRAGAACLHAWTMSLSGTTRTSF